MPRDLTVGTELSFERTFDHEDVLAFLRISRDAGVHHAEPGADGRRVVHGLLTATIPTKLGGDLNYLAREMHFEFVRAVYTGDAITCRARIDEIDERPDRLRLAMTGTCTNQHGEDVLKFATRGVIRRS